jgi:hypothetical protein
MTADAGARFLRLFVSVPASGGQRWRRRPVITVLLFLYCCYYLLFGANFPVGCFNLQSLSTLKMRKKPFHFLAKGKKRSVIRDQQLVHETIPFERLIEDESLILFCHRVVDVERERAHSCKHICNPKPHPPPTIRTPRQSGPHEFT